MASLVDSSVILDIVLDDPVWAAWSRNALIERRAHGPLLINQVVYAEVMAAMDAPDAAESLLAGLFERRDLPWDAARLAGQAHAGYRRRGGAREAILADFLIGAHAAVEQMVLITRDPRRVRTAFPGAVLVSP